MLLRYEDVNQIQILKKGSYMFELIHVARIGIVAGIIMGMTAMILNLVKFTTLDLTMTMGCLLTRQSKGIIPFVAGFSFHIFASAAIAIIYMFIMTTFGFSLTFHNSLHIGAIHTLVSGILMHILDQLSVCAKEGSIKAVGYFASNYGTPGIVTFVAGHFIYAIIVIMLLK